MSLEIIEAGPAHIPLLAALNRPIYEGTGHAPWNEEDFRTYLALASTLALIAVQDEEPLGLVIAQRAEDQMEILSLGVLPAARRAGAGKALLNHLEHAGQSIGVTGIFLEVAADNAPAIALYNAGGYVQIALRKGYYKRRIVESGTLERVDALLMKRHID